MLAENTGIDVRTTWRSAVLLLQDDVRYKNVDDSNDREDLFNDFVSELEKKEKEDRSKHRDAAMKHLQTLYEGLLEKGTTSSLMLVIPMTLYATHPVPLPFVITLPPSLFCPILFYSSLPVLYYPPYPISSFPILSLLSLSYSIFPFLPYSILPGVLTQACSAGGPPGRMRKTIF
jgi:FF domain